MPRPPSLLTGRPHQKPAAPALTYRHVNKAFDGQQQGLCLPGASFHSLDKAMDQSDPTQD